MDIRPILEKEYEANFKQWMKFTVRSNITPEMAEDAIQDACVRALSYSVTFDRDKDFSDWFAIIRRNALMDILAIERRCGTQLEYKEEMDGREYAESLSSDIVDKAKLLIDDLPEGRREICKLYFIHGLAPREIEQVVDKSNKAIRDIICRFKKQLGEWNERQLCS